jgi:hypothetical protein
VAAPSYFKRLSADAAACATLYERAMGNFGGLAASLQHASRTFALAADLPNGTAFIPANVQELQRNADKLLSASRSLAWAVRDAR